MLETGKVLQGRYRITRQLGGGGMGVVYLAEDVRLPGRFCAVKEMSPEQLAVRDREWAIQAFEQEAQMLGKLNHVGLAAVNDFFPEGGNWYLVMEYVAGESLEEWLARAPGGRLTLHETLGIVRQLCDVLEYLHHRKPPVIFRDLKPSNVMMMPNQQIKLIDFGIARFFKPGQTRDTLNMGTPGYAAPEQYGGMGQSDPRTDIYSLGVVLYRAITGYDPAQAITPFSLPPIEQLTPAISPEIAAVITRAKQLQPELRYGSVRELRTALFSPPTVAFSPEMPRTGTGTRKVGTSFPDAPPDNGASSTRWQGVLTVIAAVGGLGLCVAMILASVLFLDELKLAFNFTTQTPAPMDTKVPDAGGVTEMVTISPSPSPTSSPTVRAAEMTVREGHIGMSVEGRELSLLTVGYEGGTAIVIVGSIQGDQTATRGLVLAVSGHFKGHPDEVPADVAYHFIPSLNPDGNAHNSRYNAHDVDLNRNWATSDWVTAAAVPGYPHGKAGAGGSAPFSEPETQSLRDFIVALHADSAEVRVVVFHSSVNRATGEIYPGGNRALNLAAVYAEATDYDIEEAWAEYVTSGEAVTWFDEQGMLSLDVVIPASQTPYAQAWGTRTLMDITVQALIKVAE